MQKIARAFPMLLALALAAACGGTDAVAEPQVTKAETCAPVPDVECCGYAVRLCKQGPSCQIAYGAMREDCPACDGAACVGKGLRSCSDAKP